MKRRNFLISGAAAATAPMMARSVPLAHAAISSTQLGSLSSAKVIWSAISTPVPIGAEGKASSIASSSNGKTKTATPDLHCVFAKEVDLTALPSHAVVHLFAFTRYRLYVNGIYIGRGPCRYQNQRPEYDTRDIRASLQSGKNLIAVLVHRDAPTGRIMLDDPGFVAALETTTGGIKRIISTDTSWLSTPELSFGPREQAWSSIEEHIDARNTDDWSLPDLSRPIWKPSVVVPQSEGLRFFPRSIPLQSETERLWASATRALPADLSAGDHVDFSLPEIAQAFHVLEIDADEGTSLEVTYGLPQGEASGRCTYIARSGRQTWMGGDTFAFLNLRLCVTTGHIRLIRAAACEVRYPFERAAAFSCSDPFLNRLWTICARSLEVLSEDSYVDCADRERVEWTDDSPPAFDCTRVMMRGPDEKGKSHWGDSRLLAGLLRRIALTQQPDGQLKAHSCSERFDIHAIMEDRTCDWIVLLREYHESSGDTDLVRDLWPTLTRLLDWYRKRRTTRGLVLAREWGVWDNPLRYEVCEGAGLNAMVHRALVDASALAASIGRRADSKMLAQEAQNLQVDFNDLLWNEREGAYDGALFGPGSEIRPQSGHPFSGAVVDGRFHPTAQANLFALYSGIVPAVRIDTVRKWVLAHLEEVREPMSHYYLFQMLYAMDGNQQDEAVLTLMGTGWKNQVDSQWQTTWEELENGDGSKIHIYGMHPGYFLTAFVLGARRKGPIDRRTILIEPRFSGLDWAKGICVTEFGPVEMEWTRDGEAGAEIRCTVPREAQATLRLRLEDASGVLEIDGRPAPASRANGRMEALLLPGKHTIRLRA